MKKVILFNMITLDGFFSGPAGEIDWHQVDDEFNTFAIGQLEASGGLIFGRVTYQLMAGYWPTPMAVQTDPEVAEKMNSITKFVVSRRLKTADWNNTRVINQDLLAEITRLKQQDCGDLLVLGSANLAASLMRENLIDEYRLMVNPIILGSGIPMFAEVHQPLTIKWIYTRSFHNGNVLLTYAPI